MNITIRALTTCPPTPEKGLGLIAVDPAYQGNQKYYIRFGFQKASSFDLQNEYGVDAEFVAIKFKSLPGRGF